MDESLKHPAAPVAPPEPALRDPVRDTKIWRQALDSVLQDIKGRGAERGPLAEPGARSSRERSLAVTKLQEAIMWLGMDLKGMKEEGLADLPNPYPSSYDPSSKVIEPTADGLKL